jgi:hypothetical protein
MVKMSRESVRGFGLFLAGATATFACVYPLTASANFKRTMPQTQLFPNTNIPILDDTTLEHYHVAYLRVDLYNSQTVSGNATAVNACLWDWATPTIVCGSTAYGNTSPGWSGTNPGLGVWSNANYQNWYPYVAVSNLTAATLIHGVELTD